MLIGTEGVTGVGRTPRELHTLSPAGVAEGWLARSACDGGVMQEDGEPRMDWWGEAAARARSGAFDPALRPVSTEQALSQGPRQFFTLAAEVARGQSDPASHWEQFVQALWEQVDAGFGLTADEEDVEPPVAWFERPGGAESTRADKR